MTASVTHGRALRYAGGSARGLLYHVLGHCLTVPMDGLTIGRQLNWLDNAAAL